MTLHTFLIGIPGPKYVKDLDAKNLQYVDYLS